MRGGRYLEALADADVLAGADVLAASCGTTSLKRSLCPDCYQAT